ncbi:cytoskeleton-associated protein 2 [Cyclopterus lumpus]|uniref:Cytoskeleton-associated protein 2 C-terminal domain-containing protein n=1 Tax=Cyclopterus lumpus TaxID=8103 RepID=A0A8C2WD18_CYCLU|nr:cytoskeleton-associated protein 2 [Cyclopterus lumpus]
MDNVAVSRRNTDKKLNKENAQPAYEGKSVIRTDKLSAKPFQLTNNTKDTLARNGPPKAKAYPRSTSVEPLKKVKTVQKGAAAASDVKPRQTHSRAFLSEQIVKHQKMVAEAPKLPAAQPSSKSALGMYKGKIVQSKIGSIWKSTATVGGEDPKPSAPKTGGQKAVNVIKSRSNSLADMPGRGAYKPVQTRSKSVMDRPPQVTKPAVVSRAAGFHSARPPARTVPTTLASASSRNTRVAPARGSGIQSSKILVTNKQVNKPAVASALSQYRVTMETAEEKRAKLAEWLASKGKTFKRPAMTEPAKARVSAKPAVELKPQPQPRLGACEPDSEGAVFKTHSRTPAVMNTTLDLLETSDDDPQDNVDDIVVNLCDALEAMATPSRSDELSQVTDVVMDDCKPQYEYEGERKEMSEDVEQVKEDVEQVKEDVEQVKEDVEQVKDEVEESEDEEGESDVECVTETVPQMEDASVIKYSVKTTPYLQRVKKTIDEEASTSGSRRKSNIKDLKFLTPVRRSCRIERKASRLPPMLVDPDPCVSTLAELDDDHAYIYRKNHALPDGLSDQIGRGSVNV